MDWTREIDQRLKVWIERSGACGELREAAEYALFPGGKRIRPLSTLALLEDFDLSPELGLDSGCSLEFIHTYSLIHDDLPSMDDDDFRREKPSLHRAFSEATAVLTGDFLLTYAFEILSESNPPLVKLLARFSGARGLIEGQMLDLRESKDLVTCNRLKTGALFACAFAFAGVIAKKPIKPLIHLGEQYGIIYQWLDDLDDGENGNYSVTEKTTQFLATLQQYPNLEKTLKMPSHVPN